MNDPEKIDVNPELSAAPQAETYMNGAGGSLPTTFGGQPDDLPDLFAATPNLQADAEDPLAAMRNDPNYAELIRELEYIARQAKELFSNVEEAPSDEVWKKISSELPNLGDGTGRLED